MKQIETILPDPVVQALKAYTQAQDTPPPTSIVIQTALEEFLVQRGYLPTPRKHLRITPASQGSGYTDTSTKHDSVLAHQPTQELS